jgi:ribosomal protein L27
VAHKRSGGSSHNGRDSAGKRLGVKRFGGLKLSHSEKCNIHSATQKLYTSICKHHKPLPTNRNPL